MDLTVKQTSNKLYIGDDPQAPLAEIHFVEIGDDRLDVDHTFVSETLRGQGIGDLLVERVVDYARQHGKKIIPTCPFVKNRLERNKQYHDILA